MKDIETKYGWALVLVIAPLTSILIQDQLSTLNSTDCLAADLSSLKDNELKKCKFKILFSSAEEVMKEKFLAELRNKQSELHAQLCCIVIDKSHTVEQVKTF